jgi:hypothetical protein
MKQPQRIALGAVALTLVGLGVVLLRQDPQPGLTPSSVATPGEPPVGAPTTVTPLPTQAPTLAAPVGVVVDGGSAGTDTAAPTQPQVELAPNPFADSKSAELQYAVQLVLGPNTGPAEWKKAAEVFQRCVDVNPTNHLCKRGVYAAYERLDSDGGPATALSAPVTFNPGKADPNDRPLPEKLRIRNEQVLPPILTGPPEPVP